MDGRDIEQVKLALHIKEAQALWRILDVTASPKPQDALNLRALSYGVKPGELPEWVKGKVGKQLRKASQVNGRQTPVGVASGFAEYIRAEFPTLYALHMVEDTETLSL